MDNVVTIREFQHNLYKFIRAKENFVVTIKGQEAFVVTFKKENVVTKDNVTTKQKVISTLKQTIQSIEDKPIETPKETHWCFNCQKNFSRKREAIDLVDVYEDGNYQKKWLCGVCKSKQPVYV